MNQQTLTQAAYSKAKHKYDTRSHGNHKPRSKALTKAMSALLKEEAHDNH